MIKILIIDDSLTEFNILKNIFSSESDMEVIGYAKNGQEGFDLALKLRPDLITMDIQMPVMDGFEATRLIMSQCPTPIVVISSKVDDNEISMTYKALDVGALTVLGKPIDVTAADFDKKRKHIIDTVRSMSEIKMVTRKYKSEKKTLSRKFQVIAMGASVGGPPVLKKILSAFPTNFHMPIVVVQHIAEGFIGGFVKWLNDSCALTVKQAEDCELLQSGTVYFASDNRHLTIIKAKDNFRIKLVSGPPVSGFCPSVTELFRSVAKGCDKNAVGVLLTGMGSDGAQGLLEMKNAGAHTLIQDPESAVVFGMAGVAQSLGAADKVVELDQIADYLLRITK